MPFPKRKAEVFSNDNSNTNMPKNYVCYHKVVPWDPNWLKICREENLSGCLHIEDNCALPANVRLEWQGKASKGEGSRN